MTENITRNLEEAGCHKTSTQKSTEMKNIRKNKKKTLKRKFVRAEKALMEVSKKQRCPFMLDTSKVGPQIPSPRGPIPCSSRKDI